MKRAALFLAILMALLTAGQELFAAGDEVAYGFDKKFLPYSFVRDRESVGFEVDLLKAVFNDSGYKLDMKPMEEWERALAELSSNTLQVCSGMTRSEIRDKLFIFTERPSLVLTARFFTREEDRVARAEDLRGQTVSVKKASIYQTLVQNYGGFKVQPYETDEAALNGMWMGETIAYFGPDKTAYWYIEQNDLKNVAAVGRPVNDTAMYYAFYKGQTKLRDFVERRLGELERSGEYDSIYRKWFVDELEAGEREVLIKAAKDAARTSFAPYSGKDAGAAVLTRSGHTYSGAVIESIQPECGVSALKSAMAAAVAAGDTEIKAVVLIGGDGSIVVPNSSDRTLLLEFGRGLLVLVEPEKGEYDTVMAGRLLPRAALTSP